MTQLLSAAQALILVGLAETSKQAEALILAGEVFMGEVRIEKAGQKLKPDALPRLRLKSTRNTGHDYVSRGGLKLKAALDAFKLSPSQQLCLDVGASTGGFTDCLLRHGAQRVIATDVGYNQLDWRLRQHPAVTCLERTHIKTLTPEALAEHTGQTAITFCVIDVSFISLLSVLPHVLTLLAPQAIIIALLKPQFEFMHVIEDPEARKAFNGIVKETAHAQLILETTLTQIQERLAPWHCPQWICSPLKGAQGNTEFLLHLTSRQNAPC
ncbi:MAG: TlyA family RNA methyltransferase [Vampirovibrionales bacterium]|nr:TlyA family RNA methyltransferase [Vampirovibrionales bacterium]